MIGRRRIRGGIASWVMMAAVCPVHAAPAPERQAEKWDRGVVAVPAIGGGVLVSWRSLASDAPGVGFEVFRDGRRVSVSAITGSTNFRDAGGSAASRYAVRMIAPGAAGAVSPAVAVWAKGYTSIPLDPPPGGVTPDGEAYGYTANDVGLGDLDGDGQPDLVLKWDPTNSHDNSQSGYTGPVYLDGYTLAGKRLWRIDLGPNIRAGAHYTQFLVQDFDGDGRAEVAMKTADGTVDGQGHVIGDPKADWRQHDGEVPQADRTGAHITADGRMVARLAGRILTGPEYLTVFDGMTGKALATKAYDPPRGPRHDPGFAWMAAHWGDGYGNRVDRFLAGVAFLDGRRPSMVFGRGYYGRTAIAAWDYRDGQLTERWLFDTDQPGHQDYVDRGNHQLSIADVDGDGRDDVIYGSMAVDADGKGLWTQPLYHGDAMHVGDLDPARPGLEKFGVHEQVGRNGGIGSALLDARTGQILWTKPATSDTGRGLSADIDPRHVGEEMWGSNQPDLYDVHGVSVGPHPRQTNFAIWWDGDLLRELLDGTTISKWDWTTAKAEPLLVAEGAASNNGTKANPALQADLIGDWREEVVWRSADNRELRIYTTPWPTTHRITTLLQDPVYRAGIAWQNTAYNQPPHTGFYLGMTKPSERAE
ncbi:rhamnogalacturonan endolyase [Sphingomonas sp. SORGH_AS 950]|uniref:rhamnogalacturonan lyase n=1 Tax=Sphingomonas sp. SORGH_AS_0950 TaxID=3041792 RepID=UPI00277E69B6|nr:rhamnogalacturonan lyase [Sphingomonas sp. SORGH_AS_0950]MDQ1156075.1 rhamnogalacturonan endolyase [Sphingomonas sp. SORGH_AS_0950]